MITLSANWDSAMSKAKNFTDRNRVKRIIKAECDNGTKNMAKTYKARVIAGINEGRGAPLADSTIANKLRKGAADPLLQLVETSQLRNSITVNKIPDGHFSGVLMGQERFPLAVYHEEQAVRIPQRPFLEPAAEEVSDQIEAIKDSVVENVAWALTTL